MLGICREKAVNHLCWAFVPALWESVPQKLCICPISLGHLSPMNWENVPGKLGICRRILLLNIL